jgi:hypothetical protein
VSATASFTASSSEPVGDSGVIVRATRQVTMPAEAMGTVGETSVTVTVTVETVDVITPGGTATILGADLTAIITALQAIT